MFFKSRNISRLLTSFMISGFTTGLVMAQPQPNGTAVQLSCNCYRLTENAISQSGSVWNSAQIDLTVPFDFKFDVYLGEDVQGQQSGADGIAFVLQPISTSVGTNGGGMGYENIAPSLDIQIDTYQNGDHNDPSYDHVAIMANGAVDHNSADNLAGPENALVSGFNIEDGQWHVMRVTWDPTAMTISVYMDGSLRTSYTGDIIADIFGGDPNVFWGFTGSTGGLSNLQQFCFSIIPGLTASNLDICAGAEVDFTDESYSALGEVVGWEWNFGNGETSTDQSPGQVAFDQPGDYWVVQTITDSEGCDASDSLEVVVHANPEAAFTATDACEGEQTDFTDQTNLTEGNISSWNWQLGDGQTDNGSSVSHTYNAGSYDVTLSVVSNFGCTDSVTSSVTVFENPVAQLAQESTGFDAVFTTTLQSGEEAQWTILDTVYTDTPLNYTFPDSGWYEVTLTITNENGCSNTVVDSIYIEGIPDFDVPNVFTPNGDMINDRFRPRTYAMVEARMKIYNRWGRPVFNYEGEIPVMDEWGWDGTVNGGARAAEGTYYYVLDMIGTNGSNFSEQGTVTLLR
ncbi:MAG: PKD domain-containing protein [Flavobacteriales bacterium]|nr:PKD domain-containing protein [Flavobacteriales bacterium]